MNYRGSILLSINDLIFSRVLLDRLREAEDLKLREEQAGFRKGRSCPDQITTLRIIVEQTLEWNSSLYLNFVEYEKAFDRLDRGTLSLSSLWKLMCQYGIPNKYVSLDKKKMYDGMKCREMIWGQITDSFEVKTGVRQGCLLSPFLFLFAIAVEWIMKHVTLEGRTGIQTLTTYLEDLEFADDLALLSHSHNQMQEKTPDCLDKVLDS